MEEEKKQEIFEEKSDDKEKYIEILKEFLSKIKESFDFGEKLQLKRVFQIFPEKVNRIEG